MKNKEELKNNKVLGALWKNKYVAAVVLSMPEEWALACEGVCDGRLAACETGVHGFGYDPLFVPDGYDVSLGELPLSVKNRISHRARAVAALFDILAGE